MECLSCNDGLRGSLPCNCEAGLNITINQQAARIAELEKQLADLRGDRDTLAGELTYLRFMHEEGVLEYSTGADADDMKHYDTLAEATAASGALTRAGKDHT